MERACNLGNTLYPNTTGQFNVPFNSDVERFQASNPIHIRFYEDDPQSGILNTSLTNTHHRCIVGNTWGTIVTYEQATNNVPIDNPLYAAFMLIIIILITLKFKL